MKKKDGTHTPARPIVMVRIDSDDLASLKLLASLDLGPSVSDQIRPGIRRAARLARRKMALGSKAQP